MSTTLKFHLVDCLQDEFPVKLYMTPIYAPIAYNNQIILGDSAVFLISDKDPILTVTGVVPNSYKCRATGRYVNNEWNIVVPETNDVGYINVSDIVVSTVPSGSNITMSYAVSSSFAFTSISASYARNVNHASTADYATEANHATNADSAITADTANTAVNANNADLANYAVSAGSADNANTANSATSASHALVADSSITSSYINPNNIGLIPSASFATTASYVNPNNIGLVPSSSYAGFAQTTKLERDGGSINGPLDLRSYLYVDQINFNGNLENSDIRISVETVNNKVYLPVGNLELQNGNITVNGYVSASNFIGTVPLATTASYVNPDNVGLIPSASHANNADNSITASYVAASNVQGLTNGYIPVATGSSGLTSSIISQYSGSSGYFINVGSTAQNTTERVFILANTNAEPLSVAAQNGYQIIRFKNTASADRAWLGNDSGNRFRIYNVISGGDLYLTTTGNANVILDNTASKMGIGTITPTAKLHISGSTVTDNLLTVQNSSGNTMLFISGSKVGINNNVPAQALDVNGTIQGANVVATGYAAFGKYQPSGNSKITFADWSGNGYVTIDTSNSPSATGYVGIGTESPLAKLQISGSTTNDFLIINNSIGTTIVTSGSFQSSGSGWLNSSSSATTGNTWNIAVGSASYYGTGSFTASLSQSVPILSGNKYQLQYTYTASNASASMGVYLGGNLVNTLGSGSSVVVQTFKVAGSTNTVLQFLTTGSTTGTVNFTSSLSAISLQLCSPSLYVSGSGNVGLGTSNPTEVLTVNGNINVPTSSATMGVYKVNGVGMISFYNPSTALNFNTFIGNGAGNFTMTGTQNVGIGKGCLGANISGAGNVGIGYNACLSNTTATQNVGIGISALQNNQSSEFNVAIGANSMLALQSGNGRNVGIGISSLSNLTTGAGNIGIGNNAGNAALLTTGLNNTFIGNSAGCTDYYTSPNNAQDNNSTNVNFSTAIGIGAQVQANNCLILGGLGYYGVNVGIGNMAPTGKLQITRETFGVGTAAMTSGSATVTGTGTRFNTTYFAGEPFTVYGASAGTYTIASIASATSLTLTTPSTGSVTGRSYSSNLKELFCILPNGYTGIGTTSPSHSLEVVGDTQVGGFGAAILTQSSSYTITSTDYTLLFSGSNLIATLPIATGSNANRIFNIKNIHTSNLTVTSSNLIDNSNSWTIPQWSNMTVQSNGVQWYII